MFGKIEIKGKIKVKTGMHIGASEAFAAIGAIGTTLLMATHNRYLVDAYRQRVVELKMGRIVRDQERGRYEVDEEL